MKIIYRPSGKALEYAPLACNLYKGCPHSCAYCFGPTLPNPAKKGLTMEQWRKIWHSKTVEKADALAMLEHDCHLMNDRGDKRPVLFCFACDPYPPDEPEYDPMIGNPLPMTRDALSVMYGLGITPIILTKGGTRACRDFDILKATGGWFGQTIGMDWTMALDWEPNAATVADRHVAMRKAMAAGIKTWISVEPVVDVENAVAILNALWTLCPPDHLKLGKLSGYDKETKAIEKSINWPTYREQAREILNVAGYQEIFEPGAFEVGTYYVKAELRNAK